MSILLSCVCDSIMAKLCESGCLKINEIHEAGTNCQDVWIVGIICGAIVLVALIAKWAVWSCKRAEIMAAKNEREAKEKNEEEIAIRKQKADALNKLVDYLEKNTIQEKYDAEEGKRIKEEKGLSSEEGKYYINVLKAVMKGESIPEYS